MFNFFAVFLLLLSCNCVLNPSSFSQQLHSMTPSGVTIIQQDLGRTVNGYNIIAYGVTSISPLPQKIDLKSLSSYPSSVILSYMHGNDVNPFNLLYGYIANFLRVYEQDIYSQMVLKTGILWLVPFISIEALEIKAKQVGGINNIDFEKMTIKNMNKFPDSHQDVDCSKFPGKYPGVNLDYNFLIQSERAHFDVCGPLYAGPSQYSERQTIAIKKLFDSLKISTVLDLQTGNNTWIYPYQRIWAQSHKFNYLYKDIIQKIKKGNIELSEQPTSPIVLQKSTQKKTIQKQGYTGGFINWAASKGTVAFKYLITPTEKGQKLIKSVENAYVVIDMIIKKNAPIYSKYRSDDNKMFYIHSISLSKFIVKCQVFLSASEIKSKEYEISFGKMIEIDIVSNYPKTSKFNPEIRVSIVGTPITEVIEISRLPSVSQLSEDLIPNKTDKSSAQGQFLNSTNIIILIVAGVLIGVLSKLYTTNVEQKKYYVNIHEDKD